MNSVDCDLKHLMSFTCAHTHREESYSRRFPFLWAAAHFSFMTQEPCHGNAEPCTVIHPHAAPANMSSPPSVRPWAEMSPNSAPRAFLEGSAAYQCQQRPVRQEAAGGTKPLVQHTHWYLPSWDSLKHVLHFPATPLHTVLP